VRRPQSPRPAGSPQSAGDPKPAGEAKPAVPTGAPPVQPAAPDAAQRPVAVSLWLRVVEWVAWILLWAFAVGAGLAFGKITFSKVLFVAIMLAITVVPWLRWVRPGSVRHLPPDRVAILQGSLAIFVALVYVLSGVYVWGLVGVVVELGLALLILVRAPRAPQT
jgi:hypothetical protein